MRSPPEKWANWIIDNLWHGPGTAIFHGKGRRAAEQIIAEKVQAAIEEALDDAESN